MSCGNQCMADCQFSCQTTCEITDQCSACQLNCQTTCQASCQTACQTSSCQTACESSCQSACLLATQGTVNPAGNATLTVFNIGTAGFAIRLSGLDNSTSIPLNIYFYLNNTLERIYPTNSSPVLEHYYTQLNDGTTYTAKVVIQAVQTGEVYKTLTKTVTTSTATLPKLPDPQFDFNATIKTSNSISITTIAQTGVTNYYFRIAGGTIINNGASRTYVFTGLEPNTQYFIEIKVGGSGYRDSNWVYSYASTVALWAWTDTEREAFNNHGLVTTINYLRWNEFVDRVYSLSGNSWLTSSVEGATLSYSATKMTSTDKTLTALRFNSLRYNINAHATGGVNIVHTNDEVFGSYFITMEQQVNHWGS